MILPCFLKKLIPQIGLLALFGGVLLPQFFLLEKALVSDKASFFEDAVAVFRTCLTTTLGLSALVLAFSLFVGIAAAYVVTQYKLPMRSLWSVLLCLPFAIPAPIIAGVYTSLHDASPFLFPPINNLWGAAFVLGLASYPWVYLPFKVWFASQSERYYELAQTLGISRWNWFWRIKLPLMLPTLVVTSLLVFMEVLSDFGVVSLLGVKTLSVRVHDAMFAMYRQDWAAQLSMAGLLMPLAGVLLFLVWYGKRSTFNPRNRHGDSQVKDIGTLASTMVMLFLLVIVFLGFALPVLTLLKWSVTEFGKISLEGLPGYVRDSITLVLSVTLITTVIALAVNLAIRYQPRRTRQFWHFGALVLCFNYAVPTIMLGIALLFMSADWPQALLSNTVVLLVLGGVLTYLCFPYLSIYSGLVTINPGIDDLARTFRMGWLKRLFTVFVPMLRGGLACGVLLVGINMVKELALSEVLQPFGFRTLNMRLFEYAKVGMLEESAVFALCLILLVVYPVISLDKMILEHANVDD